MSKRMTIMLIALAIVFGGIVLWNIIRSNMIAKFLANMKTPPVAISASIAKTVKWQDRIAAVGSLVAVNGVDVTSQVSGEVVKIYFTSGKMVEKNQPLLQLDDNVDQQTLKSQEAQLELDKINYARMKTLVAKQSAAKSDFDKAASELKQAQADVDKTQVQISYKNIKAPFSGKIGIRKVNLGQYINPGEAIVSLQSINPMYVDFNLPEQALSQLKVGLKVAVTVDTFPGKTFDGKITAINSNVNQATRNILVRAGVKNDHGLLVPGMFANVNVLLPEHLDVVVVPVTAVTFSLYGDSVFVIHPAKTSDNQKAVTTKKTDDSKTNAPPLTVKREYVQTGQQRNNLVVITQGIKAGDKVVTSGQLKLVDGTNVIINNTVNPETIKSNETLY